MKLKASRARSYAVLGVRQQQQVQVCTLDERGCRTVIAHRFLVSCGGVPTPWVEVAAAAHALGATSAWVQQGRLNLVFEGPKTAEASASECLDAPARLLGPLATAAVSGFKCPMQRGARSDRRVVFPPGFAPLTELGARLIVARAGPSRTETSSIEPLHPEVRLAAMTGGSDDSGLRGRAPVQQAVLPVAETSQDWVTVTKVESQSDRRAEKHQRSWQRIALAFAIVVLLLAGGWVVLVLQPGLAEGLAEYLKLRRWGGAYARFSEHLGYLRGGGGPATGAALSTIALLGRSERAVRAVPMAALREVLEQEIEAVRQRFDALRAASSQGERYVDARTAAGYRLVMRELERIRRIAESAAVSHSERPRSLGLPRTKAEAYLVLGVNPDVSEGIAKKLVDALRMSWHPDHAKDDVDRREREDRIKEINVAWELINGKRPAA